ncbi:MAG: DNA internalization-related competence protein ComEC/Rec2 [Rudaea sp.]
MREASEPSPPDAPFPVAAALAAFAVGATLLQSCARLPPAPGVLALVALAACAAAFALARRGRGDRWLFATLVAACAGPLGFAYAAWRADARLADALPQAWEGRDVRVVGVVDDLPHATEAGARFAFAVERVETRGAPVPHRVSLAWYRPSREGEAIAAPVVHAGERWALTVRLKRPHGNVNPDGFDLEAWLLEHDLRATGYVRDDERNRRVDPFAARASDYVQRARERVRERIAAALPGAPYAGVLTALAIGDQRAIAESQWLVFNRTGVTHLVSISGLHVTVFAALAGALAYALVRRRPRLTLHVPARKLAALVGALVAFGYVLLAGAEVPAMRTLLMLGVAAAGLWLGRPGTAMLVWLWALAFVIAWDPWAGLAPGFWLSFGAVGLLLYAGNGRLRAPPARTWRARLAQSLRESARAQWVVTLGLVPGTLALFQQVALVSALANAVAIPAVTLGVVPLALFGVVVPLDWPWRLAHGALAGLMRCLEWLAALPLATWTSHAPAGWSVALAIAGVLWLLAPRGVPCRGLGAAWILPMALLPPFTVPAGGARIVVLDAGQGLAAVVATHAHALVYDTGPRFNETVDAGGRIVAPYLRAAGIARLDAMIVSHADNDHSGGAVSLLHALPVDRVVSSLPGGHPVLSAARAGSTTRCMAGAHWEWDGVAFEIVHPMPAAYAEPLRKSNDLSCVLRVDTTAGSALLTGDIEAAAEAELLARRERIRADVLVVPHHGSRTSSLPAFIEAVAPRIAIVAAGYRNRFGHPRREIMARYARVGAARPRTDRDGAITVTLEPDKPVEAAAERARRRRYWYDVTRRTVRGAPRSRPSSAVASA